VTKAAICVISGVSVVRGAFFAVLAVCAVAVSGCAASSPSPSLGASDPALRGQWVLAGGTDTFGTIDLLSQDISLSITGTPMATGRGSCSDYSATIYGSQQALTITTQAPLSYQCATADQNVLQLEYLMDLGQVRRSAISTSGLELSAEGVDLRFTRAVPLRLTQLEQKTWVLETAATISLHSSFEFEPETGATIRFDSATKLSGTTKCASFTGTYRQVANQLVASNLRYSAQLSCNDSADSGNSSDPAATDVEHVLDGGFTFALTQNSLALSSARAGLALGFSQQGAP
jgi:heat shock protein HslJ